MKKELEYFMIDGEFGGNQDWFTNIVMNVGGCGAATACDSCIYLAKYKGMKKLYPFDLEQIDKEAYKKFKKSPDGRFSVGFFEDSFTFPLPKCAYTYPAFARRFRRFSANIPASLR